MLAFARSCDSAARHRRMRQRRRCVWGNRRFTPILTQSKM